MDESSRTFLKTLAAVAFLSALTVVLARPVWQSDGGRREAARKVRPVAREQAQTPEPVVSETPEEPEATVVELTYRRYPKGCLNPVDPPPGAGLVAAARYGAPGRPHRIALAQPGGDVLAEFVASFPLQWSPSGRWLATRGLELFDASGNLVRPFRVLGNEPWAWSPIADCLVVADRDRLVVVQPPARKTVLVEGYGAGNWFYFSPDGRHLFTMEGVIDLRMNPVRPTERRPLRPAEVCPDLEDLTQESCAFGASLIAAISDRKLVLTDGNGTSIRPLTSDSGWRDDFPEWGPSGTGVLFVRKPIGSGSPEVWFIPEGGNPRPTGLRLATCPCRGEAWVTYLDWSVSPPGGSMPEIPGA